MSVVTTSLVVRFSPGTSQAQGRLTAEIDGREDGLNAGKTRFEPGDPVGFLVYASEGVRITAVTPTLGSVGSMGIQSVPITEFVQFAKTREATLRAPATGGISGQWVGRDGGAFSTAGGVVSLQQEAVGVLYASYTALAHGYMLRNVPAKVGDLEEFEVMIYIEGEHGG